MKNKAAQELNKLSYKAKLKKHGGKEGFRKHMTKLSRSRKSYQKKISTG